MFSKLRTILQDVFELEGGSASDSSMELAIAGLLSEVAAADHDVDPREAEVKVHMLEKLLETDASEAEVYMNNARTRAKESVSLYEYTDKLRQLSQEQRYKLIEAMWQVAWADGSVDPLEDAVIRKTAELLYVDHALFIKAKLATQPKD
ncbi:TerB family tellurite resistance protein [Parasalinivibrio latis]|uniref:tellurite resistance TerB family protein n=1 Tax=Parasalinivibrio latis TaxID=2952610 RepID=UPI0030DEA5E2